MPVMSIFQVLLSIALVLSSHAVFPLDGKHNGSFNKSLATNCVFNNFTVPRCDEVHNCPNAADQTICANRGQYNETPATFLVYCGSGLSPSSDLMCDENLKCPLEVDKYICWEKKLKSFVCGPEIKPMSFDELCGSHSNLNCPNNLDKFVCKTLALISNKTKRSQLGSHESPYFVQFNKSKLCTLGPPNSSHCQMDRLADLSIYFHRFNYYLSDHFLWIIRDMNEFVKQGASQFDSSEAFRHKIHLKHLNWHVYTLSHPNYYAELITRGADFDLTFCPEKVDKAICSVLPALKKKLTSSSNTLQILFNYPLLLSLLMYSSYIFQI